MFPVPPGLKHQIEEPSRRKQMKKMLGILAACAVISALLLPAAPASAANAGAAVGACQVNLPVWPGGGSSNCGTGLPGEGSAVGAFLPGGPVCQPTCQFNATVESYSELCVSAEPPLTGNASGVLSVTEEAPVVGLGGTVSAHYRWVRVGLVAVVVFDGPSGTNGGGVAAFLPDPRGGLPTCDAPGPLSAHVVGLALAAQQ
jgi:hypothetical protein